LNRRAEIRRIKMSVKIRGYCRVYYFFYRLAHQPKSLPYFGEAVHARVRAVGGVTVLAGVEASAGTPA